MDIEYWFKNLIKHISACIFPPIQSKLYWENCFLDGNNNLGHKCVVNFFSHTFSTNCVGRWVLIINNAKSFKNSFCWDLSLLKGIVNPKKTWNWNCRSVRSIFNWLFGDYSSTNMGLVLFQTYVYEQHDQHPHVF
jgi:hypothetical protein